MARINAEQVSIPVEGEIEVGDIDSRDGIKKPRITESIAVTMNMDDADLEAFMHEPVAVMIHPSSKEGDLSGASVTVNGDRIDIPRGKTVTIKRKFVEALARARTVTYIQNWENMNPTEITPPAPRVALSYPFDVVRDSPKGRAWYESLYATR